MIYHGDTETRSKLLYEELTERVLGAAIEVHRALGPGLLGSAYEECLCHEFHLRGIGFSRQVPLPVEYKGVKLDCGYRLDAGWSYSKSFMTPCLRGEFVVRCRLIGEVNG